MPCSISSAFRSHAGQPRLALAELRCFLLFIFLLLVKKFSDCRMRYGLCRAESRPCPPAALLGRAVQFQSPHLCFCWKWNDIGLLRFDEGEPHALRLSNTVFTPQMPIRFHC